MKKRYTRRTILTFCLFGGACLAGITAATVALHTLDPPTHTHNDPFAGRTPRTPCALRSSHDMQQQERYDTTSPKPDNPAYCDPLPNPVCPGTHRGKLHVRYDNTTLLRTGTATLDIATDDGLPLGAISVGPVDNVRVAVPSDPSYTGDSTARFILTSNQAVGSNEPYGDGPFEQSTRQLTYPLSISIQAWCGQRTYKADVVEKLKVLDTVTGKTYTR